jgi:hydrogenase nickel incorporation protein HypA/HybF
MHELAVTEGILKTVIEASQQNGARRITTIHLVIGELSSIVDDSVQFYFDLLSKETLAENATLNFRREPSVALCLDCAHQFNASAPLESKCPNCGSVRLQVRGGREFFIESIEVEDEDSRR